MEVVYVEVERICLIGGLEVGVIECVGKVEVEKMRLKVLVYK